MVEAGMRIQACTALADFAMRPQKMGRWLLLKKSVSMEKMPFVMDLEGGESLHMEITGI